MFIGGLGVGQRRRRFFPNAVCRGLVFRDVTVSTVIYRVGGSRETNTTVSKLQCK